MKKNFNWGIIIIIIIIIIGGCNLYLYEKTIELIFYVILFILLVIFSLCNNNKIVACIIYLITFIFSIASPFIFKNNEILLLFYMFQVYNWLHFLHKVLEKKDNYKYIFTFLPKKLRKKSIYKKIKYFVVPFPMNFCRFFLICCICTIFKKHYLFSQKLISYSFLTVLIDSFFSGFYESYNHNYNKELNIENKLSFIEVCKYYNWGFFIMYAIFNFFTYINWGYGYYVILLFMCICFIYLSLSKIKNS